ncbi:MAG: hypothetical protein VW313_01495, partial [Gammaproteobacteria bacterium]
EVGKGYASQALDALENLADDDAQDEAIAAIEAIDDELSDQIPATLEPDTSLQSESSETESASGTEIQHIELAESDHLIDRDVDSNPAPVLPRPRRMQFQ